MLHFQAAVCLMFFFPVMLPVEPISHYAQDDAYNCIHSNEVGPCQNLVVQPKAIVRPLTVAGAIQLQQRTPVAVTRNRSTPAPNTSMTAFRISYHFG
jgi:hypothetical protein